MVYKRDQKALRDQYNTTQLVPTMTVGNMAQKTIVSNATLTATTTYTGSHTLLGFSDFAAVATNTHSANDSGNIAMEFDLYRDDVFLGTLTAGGTVGDSATETFELSGVLIGSADQLKYRISANHTNDFNLDLFLAFNPVAGGSSSTAAITINGYDSSGDYIKVTEQDPITGQKIYEVPFSVAAGAAASGTTSEYIDMDGYNSMNFSITSTNTAAGTMQMQVYVTQQDDGTAASACTYQDVTKDLETASATSFSTSTTIRDTNNFFAGYKYVKFELVQATSAGTSAFKLETTKYWA